MYDYIRFQNIVLEKQKAIYFFIPKVACSSLKKVCADVLEFNVLDNKDTNDSIHHLDFPHIRKEKIEEYDSYFKFVFVRNPWDRLVSCYLDKVLNQNNTQSKMFENGVFKFWIKYDKFKPEMTFTEFVESVASIPDDEAEAHFRSQYRTISKNGVLFVNFIGKFEHLDHDFRKIRKHLKFKSKLPHYKKTKHQHYSFFYDEQTKKLVEKRYEKDIRLFKYTFIDKKIPLLRRISTKMMSYFSVLCKTF